MYDVALLAEKALSDLDAAQVTGLHAEIDDTVRYHVLVPGDQATGRLHASMSTLGNPGAAPELGAPTERPVAAPDDDATRAVQASVAALRAHGHQADGATSGDDPIEALAALVRETSAAEAIVLTEPHVVKELFGLDWSARARRHLEVPVLHLLERETFSEQGAGGGEGPTGL